MTTLTAHEALDLIISNVASPDVRDVRDLKIGEVIQQGDVYIHWMPLDWPRGKLLGTRQIAVGNTVGARHVVVGLGFEVYEGVKLPDYVKFVRLPARLREPAKKAILGPVVVLTSPLATGEGLPHPEHAHFILPCGVGQVQYQLDGKTMLAVMD